MITNPRKCCLVLLIVLPLTVHRGESLGGEWPGNAVIFSGSGAGLFNDPRSSFPTVTPVVSGTSLQFFDGGTNDLVWARFPLFGAGEIDSLDNDIHIKVQIDHSIFLGDDDFRFGITDNSGVVNVLYANNSGGAVATELDSTLVGNQLILGTQNLLFNGAPVAAPITATFTLGAFNSDVAVSLASFEGLELGGPPLARSTGLDFVLVSGNNDNIQLDAITITVVPEPGAFISALVLIGCVSFGPLRRRV